MDEAAKLDPDVLQVYRPVARRGPSPRGNGRVPKRQARCRGRRFMAVTVEGHHLPVTSGRLMVCQHIDTCQCKHVTIDMLLASRPLPLTFRVYVMFHSRTETTIAISY